MNYVFPYHLVSKGSKVALYGFGVVGRDFFEQMRHLKYCNCVLCVDKQFEFYATVSKPFGKIRELASCEYDYVIIAILDEKVARDVKRDLCELGIDEDKIIWSADYQIKTDLWPMNKKRYLMNPEFYMSIIDKYKIANSIYGGGNFYQSFTELGIKGTRNIQERIGIYKIREFLKETDCVLDIGCNCGFFDLQISPFVKSVLGIDIDSNFIEIANETKDYLEIRNVTFQCRDYYNEKVTEKYNAIFALAIHTNIMVSGASEEAFVECLYNNLEKGGYLFFESHNLKNDAERYKRICEQFIKKGMLVCLRENYFSDFDREIIVLKKE